MRYPVGRAALVFGALPAPALADKVLELKVVSFSDGDPGPRKSNQCGGEVVGREIDATGVKPGKQVLKPTVIVREGGICR